MSDADQSEREFVIEQLNSALEEIRFGSLSMGLDMIETTRDQLERQEEQLAMADDQETTEE